MLNSSVLSLGSVAGLLLLAHGVSGCSCTLVDCEATLEATGALGYGLEERAHLMVELCRNDVCSSGEVDTDDVDTAVAGAIVEAKLNGDAAVNCWLDYRSTVSWTLHAQFRQADEAGDFNDGDHVVVKVVDLETNTLLFDFNQQVEFEEVQPNGANCGPECLVETIDLTTNNS